MFRSKLGLGFKLGFGGLGIVFALHAGPAFAHHSFAMFDAVTKTALKGTVKEFQWTNPHAWILLMVADPEGRLDQWAIEMVGPSGLARRGWVPKTLRPGMEITVTIHPLKDGSHGGQFMTVAFPDGTQLSDPVTNDAAAREPAEP